MTKVKQLKNFALIGAAGYIAPRHMKAIAETGNRLTAALDPSDSVGILDSHFPDARFFTEFERFDRHIDKIRGNPDRKIDYMSICSLNYLHDSHMRFALRSSADAICEKPLVLNPWNIDALLEVEQNTGQTVHTILQLRLHPSIIALRDKVRNGPKDTKYEVDLTYMTSRGSWYLQSWKGDTAKSGGIATNIGIHFFDMLHFVFGNLQENIVYLNEPTKSGGYLEYQDARVRWFLTIDADDLPEAQKKQGQRTYRSITVNGEEIEFSAGFTDLHTVSYQEILAGRGFRLEENRACVEAASYIRTAPVKSGGDLPHYKGPRNV